MPTWVDLDTAPRQRPDTLTRDAVPDQPGVYAWYRDGERQYVGKAAKLRRRVWGNHLGQNRSLRGSAFRRNVAEHLGFASAADINARRVVLTEEQRAAVRAWIISCEVAWLVCGSKDDAIELEARLLAEFRPPLNQR
jgi:hypothetical protein